MALTLSEAKGKGQVSALHVAAERLPEILAVHDVAVDFAAPASRHTSSVSTA